MEVVLHLRKNDFFITELLEKMPTAPDLSNINIEDFKYNLPDERIAKFPKENRDESKLLIHKNGIISQDQFKNIASYLPAKSLMVMNNTRVVRARLFFRKPTGALIEIFCLEPVSPTSEIQMAFQQRGEAIWNCMVGNARRWKSEPLKLELDNKGEPLTIKAEKIERSTDAFLIKFSWKPKILTLSEILELAGKIPLPPYLNRDAVDKDTETYQTVYARYDGSVAAPTAGLHFTETVFDSLKKKRIALDYLTLHVGAGTFKPVGDDGIDNHEMHTEQVLVSRNLIENLLQNIGHIIAVGTTSVRTLESLYWFGVNLEKDHHAIFKVKQFDPYQNTEQELLPITISLKNILNYMNRNQLDVLAGSTQLMIIPGYKFRIINGMITNFHQPRSTLLLLISAWLDTRWKDIYKFAMQNNFRFLSYGDSCLFL